MNFRMNKRKSFTHPSEVAPGDLFRVGDDSYVLSVRCVHNAPEDEVIVYKEGFIFPLKKVKKYTDEELAFFKALNTF